MMTFAMSYAYSENYILVLSHDEVVHLKCSMINKMPGLGFDKYANLKVGYAFMMGHAGKKLVVYGTGFCTASRVDQRNGNWTGICWRSRSIRRYQSWMRDLLHHV